jgi:hypothetical protein
MSQRIRVLHVVNWNRIFENHRTRVLSGPLKWVLMPTRQDGSGFSTLMDHPDGAAHYGCWTLLCEVAAKCTPRGYLFWTSGQPAPALDRRDPAHGVDPIETTPRAVAHDVTSLSRQSRVPTPILSDAIKRLLSPVGWLEWVELEIADGEDIAENLQPTARKTAHGVDPISPAQVRHYGRGRGIGRGNARAREGPPIGKASKAISGVIGARRESQGFSGERNGGPAGKTLVEVFAAETSSTNSNEPSYPVPASDPLPRPLFGSTANQMLKAIDVQIGTIKAAAKAFRIPITSRTAEGTEFQSGWKLPQAALEAMAAWERRRTEIVRALAG